MNPFEDTIIDHLNIGVSDAARSKAFYEAALAPLGARGIGTDSARRNALPRRGG